MDNLTVKVPSLIKTEVNTQENGLTVKQLAKVLKHTLTNVYFQEPGLKVK